MEKTITDFRAFEATPGISVIVHADAPVFTHVAVSNDFIQESGLKKEDVIGKGHFEIFPESPDHTNFTGEQNLRFSFSYILKNKKPHEIPLQRYDIPNGDGTFRQKYWRVKNAPILSDNGDVLFIVHSAQDITKQVVAEQEAETSKGLERVYNFFKYAPVIIGFLRGEDYIIELANEGLLQVWSQSSKVIGKRLFEAIPFLESQGLKQLLDKVFETGESYHAFESPTTLTRDGKEEVFFFDFIYKAFYEEGTGNKASGIVCIGLNVTERVTARQRIKESEEKYRTLFNTLDQGFCVLEMIFDNQNNPVDYKFLETNHVFEKQTGLRQAVGKTARELVPNLENHWFELYGKVVKTGEAASFIEGSAAMGRWFEVSAFPMWYEGSRKVALLFTDISERKKAEDALQQSERNLRNMILQAPVAMGILKGPSFIVEIANERMYKLWGRPPEVLLNKPIFEGLPEVRDQGYEELLANVYNTGNTFSAYGIPVNLPREGQIEKVYINLLYEAFREGDGTISGIMAVATDVTDQAKARLKMEESHRELQFALNVMPQMVWETLPNGSHEFYNKQWYDYTGLSYEESKDTGWNKVLHVDDQERSWKVWKHSLETGDPYEIEYRMRRHDGTYRWFLGRALPLKDETGSIVKWFGTCTDVDDQKRAAQLMEEMVKERTNELKLSIQELERSNANLEEFAYAASHDLKEPIRKIRTFSDRIKQRLKDRLHDEDMTYFERMDRATERMQSLIEDLLAYSHVSSDTAPPEMIDLNKKMVQVLEDLEIEVAEKKANIVVGPLPVIKGYRRQILQLFQNLISNAIKFSKPGLAPEVHITSKIVSRNENIPGENTTKDYHLIQISDNGIGFEQQYADRIFKMFQRLHGKQEYDGTGIGLAIARKVIENHNGFVEAESTPGAGATLKIFLPVDA